MTAPKDLPCYGRSTDFVFTIRPRDWRKVERAKAACDRCPVKQQCLNRELDWMRQGIARTDGIYGGTTPEERQQILDREPQIIVIDHGEDRGYTQHRRAGQDACTACKQAHNREKQWRDQQKRAQPTPLHTAYMRTRKAAALTVSWMLRHDLRTEQAQAS